MGKPRQTVCKGNAEALISDGRMNWLKVPSYGMPSDLNRLYNKTKTKQALLNSKNEQDRQDVLNVIQLIIANTNITFVNKLHLINELIEVNKDYFDAYDTIVDDAIALEKE
ncbi:hypothetical protein [Dysgonomonas sp.]